MPVFRSGQGNAPAWCELESFEFVELKNGESRDFDRSGRKEEFIVCRGSMMAAFNKVECTLPEGSKLDLNGGGVKRVTVRACGDALVCRLVGRWKSITSSGVFTAQTAEPPKFDTPHNYVKTTGFDNHYHDCDEYWIFFEGAATVASEGKTCQAGPGDCVATGMGWHHDVLSVKDDKPIRAIWFEGTLEGQKRVGHLWEPQHGKAKPRAKRV